MSKCMVAMLCACLLVACGKKSGDSSIASTQPSLPLMTNTFKTEEERETAVKAFDIFIHDICPAVTQKVGLLKYLNTTVSSANMEAQSEMGWNQVVSLEFELKNDVQSLGKASSHVCFFEIGSGKKPGVFGKNVCVIDFCQRAERPKNKIMMTFIDEPRFDFVLNSLYHISIV